MKTHNMKTNDFTYAEIAALSLRCPMKIPECSSYQDILAGAFLFMPAGREEMKPFRKAALADLQDRRAKGTSYENDFGHVKIGGKAFTYYPGPKAIVSDYFAQWIDANAHRLVRKDGNLAGTTKALHQADVEAVPYARQSLTAKTRAQELPEPTFGLSKEEAALFAQASMFSGITEKLGKKTFDTSNILSNEIAKAFTFLHRRSYAKSIDHFLWIAAIALKAAEHIARNHEKTEECK